MSNIALLRNICRGMLNILDHAEPGLAVWRQAYERQSRELLAFYGIDVLKLNDETIEHYDRATAEQVTRGDAGRPAVTNGELVVSMTMPPVCAIHNTQMTLSFYMRGPGSPMGNNWVCLECDKVKIGGCNG